MRRPTTAVALKTLSAVRGTPVAVVLCALATARSEDLAEAAALDAELALAVDRALGLARGALLSGRELAGKATLGESALAALAAIRAGASPSHGAVSGALARVFADVRAATADDYVGTYTGALLLMLLDELGRRAAAWAAPGVAEALVQRLLELQEPSGGWGDCSRTGFAAAGLDAAERLGVRVGVETWRRLADHLVRSQLDNGGWAYRPGELRPTGSMTAEAASALLCAGADPCSPELVRAIEWLKEAFTTDSNPGELAGGTGSAGGGPHRFYYLAALGSLARANGGFPEASWARDGARALVGEQMLDGTWAGDERDCPTAFAVLFLSEARLELGPRLPVRRPVLVSIEPGRRHLDPAGVKALDVALVRWTGLRGGVALRRLGRGEVSTGGRGLLRSSALVVLLAGGGASPSEDDMRELAAFVREGGFVVVEGDPGFPEAELLELAGRLAPGRSVRLGWDSEVLAGPAAPGPTVLPRLFGLSAPGGEPARIAVLAAPEGLYSILGAREIGVRSGVARAAVNIFAYGSSR